MKNDEVHISWQQIEQRLCEQLWEKINENHMLTK